jgi:AraC family transcriptional regulator
VPSFNQVQFHDRAITEVTRAVMRAMEAGADGLYADTVSAWLSAHILFQERSIGLDEDTRRAGGISDKRLRRVIEFMSAHYAEPLTLEQLSSEAGISKYHFTRLFREKVGKTPFRYLSETRLAAARAMLVTTDLRISDIAFGCGFAAASHFTTAFTARYGCSPLAFRNTYIA